MWRAIRSARALAWLAHSTLKHRPCRSLVTWSALIHNRPPSAILESTVRRFLVSHWNAICSCIPRINKYLYFILNHAKEVIFIFDGPYSKKKVEVVMLQWYGFQIWDQHTNNKHKRCSLCFGWFPFRIERKHIICRPLFIFFLHL